MSNLEKLQKAGVVESEQITAEEKDVIESMSPDEVNALLKSRSSVNRWLVAAGDRISLCF